MFIPLKNDGIRSTVTRFDRTLLWKKSVQFSEAIDIDNSMDLCRLKRRIHVALRTIVYM